MFKRTFARTIPENLRAPHMKMWGFEAKRARKFTRTSPRTLPWNFHDHAFFFPEYSEKLLAFSTVTCNFSGSDILGRQSLFPDAVCTRLAHFAEDKTRVASCTLPVSSANGCLIISGPHMMAPLRATWSSSRSSNLAHSRSTICRVQQKKSFG